MSAREAPLRTNGALSMPEKPNVQTMGDSQMNHTAPRDPPSLGTRTELHRNIAQAEVVRVWGVYYAFKQGLTIETVEAEIKWTGERQTTTKTLKYADLTLMEGGCKALDQFRPEGRCI